ncbi:MAG: hypothetical protein MI919_41995, partial [Holophagales bacterium]|nr:hypothetical protein [Holophagales bacterium]
AAFRAGLAPLADGVEALLRADRERTAGADIAERLRSKLGAETRAGSEAAGELIDPAALARQLPPRRDRPGVDPGRRARLERVLATLHRHLDAPPEAPGWRLVHRGRTPLPDPLAARVVEHDEPLAAAAALFDEAAAETVAVVRAARIARLELSHDYRPELHDEAFARFDWQAMNTDELRLVPPVLAVDTTEGLYRGALAPFSRLLASARPAHVLVLDEAAGAGRWDEPGGFHPGFAQLAMAHREVFVLQSTLARPAHLWAGFTAMADALVPAAAIVAVPSWSAPSSPELPAPELQLELAHLGRATPCFRYDPAAGPDHDRRFELNANPAGDRRWPRLELEVDDAELADLEVTFADAAALHPAWNACFRPLPAGEWSDEQVSLARWLELDEEERRRRWPVVWWADGDGVLMRTLVSRELAFATRDRLRAWQDLQLLGGRPGDGGERADGAAVDAEQRGLGEARAAERRAA